MSPCRAAALVVALVVTVSCSSSGPARADPRHPGNASELLKRIKRNDGRPILIKGATPYWLIPSNDAAFHVTGPLRAMYPYIKGYDCLLRPVHIGNGYNQFQDAPQCTNGGYDAEDLFMYPLHVATDGSVTVDTNHTIEVNPSG